MIILSDNPSFYPKKGSGWDKSCTRHLYMFVLDFCTKISSHLPEHPENDLSVEMPENEMDIPPDTTCTKKRNPFAKEKFKRLVARAFSNFRKYGGQTPPIIWKTEPAKMIKVRKTPLGWLAEPIVLNLDLHGLPTSHEESTEEMETKAEDPDFPHSSVLGSTFRLQLYGVPAFGVSINKRSIVDLVITRICCYYLDLHSNLKSINVNSMMKIIGDLSFKSSEGPDCEMFKLTHLLVHRATLTSLLKKLKSKAELDDRKYKETNNKLQDIGWESMKATFQRKDLNHKWLIKAANSNRNQWNSHQKNDKLLHLSSVIPVVVDADNAVKIIVSNHSHQSINKETDAWKTRIMLADQGILSQRFLWMVFLFFKDHVKGEALKIRKGS